MKSSLLLRPISLVVAISMLASCQMMTTMTTSCDDTGLCRFERADKNHDNKLSREEASDFLVTDKLQCHDLNGDGRLSWEEWSCDGGKCSREEFEAYDRNHDGYITLKEALKYGRHSPAFDKLFTEADKDHDGFLSRDEVKECYEKHGPPQR
jgi:hypothetical protein